MEESKFILKNFYKRNTNTKKTDIIFTTNKNYVDLDDVKYSLPNMGEKKAQKSSKKFKKVQKIEKK
jgi:hypothetical protein